MFNDFKEIVFNFVKSRTFLFILVMVLLFSILLQRVFFLQIVQGEEYVESFELRTKQEVSLPSTRGRILDRNGQVLAYSELSYSVTIEDNGSYANNKEKSARLNDTIYRLCRLIEKNGDSVINNFGIIYNNGKYEFVSEGNTLLRFKADIYGVRKITELEPAQELATPEEMIDYLCEAKIYNIPDTYTEEEVEKYGLATASYTEEEKLQIINIRYAMAQNGYRRYVSTEVASNVCDETVAAVLENQSSLQGVDIEEKSRRVYPDAEYFSSIIGYIGKASEDELEALQKEDESYELTDMVGKSGLEQYLETELQGTKGHQIMYVNNVGKVQEIEEEIAPIPGNDVYLTIDKDLQMAVYNILEQKLAGILVSKIRNIKEYVPGANSGASSIVIPIYDVYYALFDNYIIDATHFMEEDATELEKSVQSRFEVKLQSVIDSITGELTAASPKAYQDLSQEMKNYMSYLVSDVLMGDNQILMKSAVDTSDQTYKDWTENEVISLQEYLQYAISMNWIDVSNSKLAIENEYLNSDEIYSAVLTYIQDYLKTDAEFQKMVYKYMILEDRLTGREVCLLLYDQGVLEYDADMISRLNSGSISAYQFMIDKITNLEITPAQLALEPCTAGLIVTAVDTGEVLAAVTYPGYDNNRLTNSVDADYYSSLQKDKSSPFVNRVTQERTAPGSTFKPLSAIAGLEEGAVTAGETIVGRGRFTEITPSPTCWIFNQYGGVHGAETMVTAIRDSCNYYFYEMAYRMGNGRLGKYDSSLAIEKLQKYVDVFGLNTTSGIELDEWEPENPSKDAIRAVIGQDTNNYTLSQIVRYISTIANGGTCYNLTLLGKSVDADGNLVEEYGSSVYNTLDVSASSLATVQSGMRAVALNTSSLKDLGVSVAGKTGTAQQSKSHPNHALFVGYAPYENPEISIAVRIANGYTSGNAAEVTADVIKYYYNLADDTEILTGQASAAGNVVAD